MCQEEFNKVSETNPFSWKGKCKFFTDNIEFLSRVTDGSFNNSKFKTNRYTHLIVYDIENLDAFERVSNNELMLRISKQSLVKVLSINKAPK